MIGRVPIALAFVLVVLVGLAAKLPEAVLPIGTDTGMYATYARMIAGGARPYVDFYDVHPPLTYYYWALVQALAGADWSRTCLGNWGSLAPQPCISLVAHAFDLGLSVIASVLAYAIARRLGLRPAVGLLAAVFIAWFANASMISMEGSSPTKLTLVPSTLAVYAFVRSLDGGRGELGWAIAAGASGVLAGLAKQPGLLTLAALLAYALPAALRTPAGRRRMLWIGAGLVGVVAATALFLWRIGSLGGFLDEAWRYNAERFLIGYWQTPLGLTSPATRIDRVATEAAGLLFVGALIGGLALWLGPTRPPQRLLLVWGVFSLAAIAGFREFAQVVPSLALLAAVGIGRLWEQASRDGLGLGRPLAGRLALVVLLGSIFVLSSGFQVIEVRQVAPPGPIFAWGNAGQIYALSGRQPATRFVIAEFTNGTSPRPNQSRDEVIGDLQTRPPAVIVVDPHTDEAGLRLSDFPGLARVMEACYARVNPGASVPGWGVYVEMAGDGNCVPKTIAALGTRPKT